MQWARHSAFALTVLGGWTALALLFAVTTSLTYMSTGRPPLWGLSVGMALSDWWVWALLTFPVLALARRLPLRRQTLGRNAPIHLAAAISIAVLKVAVDRWMRQHVFGFPVTYFLPTSLVPPFVIYWAIVAAAHGLGFYRDSRERELEASQLTARLAEARLQLLQMQLQPHFLFNTLHTISELVHEEPEAADRMIAGLSELLREAIHVSGTREVPLATELQLLGRYVDIQTARFGDRLEVTFDVDEETLTARLPSLILQPLVENAIRHGLASRAAPGRVDVRARVRSGWLTLEVADDGAGLDGAGTVQEGVGLGNTRARLRELYGDRQSFELRPRPGGGATATVAVPFRPASHEHANPDRGR